MTQQFPSVNSNYYPAYNQAYYHSFYNQPNPSSTKSPNPSYLYQQPNSYYLEERANAMPDRYFYKDDFKNLPHISTRSLSNSNTFSSMSNSSIEYPTYVKRTWSSEKNPRLYENHGGAYRVEFPIPRTYENYNQGSRRSVHLKRSRSSDESSNLSVNEKPNEPYIILPEIVVNGVRYNGPGVANVLNNLKYLTRTISSSYDIEFKDWNDQPF